MATRSPRLSREHLSQLTPQQRRVLDLIAAGRTNYEIAQELGVSLDGAKYHVREILARLDVDSREEAAELWRESRSLRARFHSAIAGLGGLVSQKAALTSLAVAGSSVAAIGAAVIIVSFGDGGGEVADLEVPPGTPTAALTFEWPGDTFHTIAPGDTLASIPAAFNVAPDVLLAMNPGLDPTRSSWASRFASRAAPTSSSEPTS